MGMVSSWWPASDERIDDLTEDPSGIETLFDSEEGFDLDKAWHGIHFVLTGTAEDFHGPLGFITCGGDYLSPPDDEDLIVRTLTSDQVRDFDDALSGFPTERFVERFDPAAMTAADVYPAIWDRAITGEEDVLEYLLEFLEILRNGVRDARDKGVGLITYIG